MIEQFIKEVGIEGARYIEENIDKQYLALKTLYNKLNTDKFLTLIVKNALISYQLTSKGEEYWMEFSEYFSTNPDGSLEDFLKNSQGNRMYHKAKLSRLKKLEDEVFGLEYYENMEKLKEILENKLESTGKTVYFAVKMYGYGARIVKNKFIPYPMSIPIPYDLRIIRLSERLGWDFNRWNQIALATKVPPLHIDSILWPLLSKDKNVIQEYTLRFNIPKILFSLIY